MLSSQKCQADLHAAGQEGVKPELLRSVGRSLRQLHATQVPEELEVGRGWVDAVILQPLMKRVLNWKNWRVFLRLDVYIGDIYIIIYIGVIYYTYFMYDSSQIGEEKAHWYVKTHETYVFAHGNYMRYMDSKNAREEVGKVCLLWHTATESVCISSACGFWKLHHVFSDSIRPQVDEKVLLKESRKSDPCRENLKGKWIPKKQHLHVGHVLSSQLLSRKLPFDCKATSNIHDPLGISPFVVGRNRFLRLGDDFIFVSLAAFLFTAPVDFGSVGLERSLVFWVDC